MPARGPKRGANATRNLMLKNSFAKFDNLPTPMIVDLGYWSEEAKARLESIVAAGVSRSRAQLIGNLRTFIEIPRTKEPAILARFPIVAGQAYWGSTHHWRGLLTGEDPT